MKPMYMHCKDCLDTLPPNMAPKDYANGVLVIQSDGRFAVECQRHLKPVVVFPEDVSEYLRETWFGENKDHVACGHCNEGETHPAV